MGADLHIHVLNGVDAEIVRRFGSNTLGGPFWQDYSSRENSQHFASDFSAIGNTPSVWIGGVSWLKAALFDDGDSFVPNCVEQVNALFAEGFRVVDDALIEQVRAGMTAGNTTAYAVTHADEVLAFLEQHRGDQAFTISW